MIYLAAAIVTLASAVGVLLTLFTLPGAWVALAVALLCQWWQPDMFSWWTLGLCGGVALLGEVIEFASSAVGAKKVGGSRAGAWGSLGGALAGAIIGSFFVPPIGTIVGAVLGAGTGALLSERHIKGREWDDAAKIGAGAAAGRLVATIVKILVAVVVAFVLAMAAWWP